MKNNILGFAVYLMAAILFSPSVGIILLAMKENADRCHYYGGKWNMKDLVGMKFVQDTLAEGWETKDSINYNLYTLNE